MEVVPLLHGGQEGVVSFTTQWCLTTQRTNHTVTHDYRRGLFLLGKCRLNETLKDEQALFLFAWPHPELTSALTVLSQGGGQLQHARTASSTILTTRGDRIMTALHNRAARFGELGLLAQEHTASRSRAALSARRLHGTRIHSDVAFLSQGWGIFWLSDFSASESLKD